MGHPCLSRARKAEFGLKLGEAYLHRCYLMRQRRNRSLGGSTDARHREAHRSPRPARWARPPSGHPQSRLRVPAVTRLDEPRLDPPYGTLPRPPHLKPPITPEEGERVIWDRHREWYMSPHLADACPVISIQKQHYHKYSLAGDKVAEIASPSFDVFLAGLHQV